jgi:hypothetical protein
MKLIEALKGLKELKRKASDLRDKIARHSAYKSTETAVYGSKEDQTKQVKEWLQAHSDIIKEIEKITLAIHTTNLATMVTITIGGVDVTKSIAAWIIRRTELSGYDFQAWAGLTDRRIVEGYETNSAGEKTQVSIVRCYDPKERDNKIGLYNEEPSLINSKMEVVNAITDLIDA